MSEHKPADSTRLIENPRTRVTRWHLAPGTATGYHRHEYDYVIVPLTDSPMKLVEPAGERTIQLEAGVPYFREEGVEHDVINPGDQDIVFIEVELL